MYPTCFIVLLHSLTITNGPPARARARPPHSRDNNWPSWPRPAPQSIRSQCPQHINCPVAVVAVPRDGPTRWPTRAQQGPLECPRYRMHAVRKRRCSARAGCGCGCRTVTNNAVLNRRGPTNQQTASVSGATNQRSTLVWRYGGCCDGAPCSLQSPTLPFVFRTAEGCGGVARPKLESLRQRTSSSSSSSNWFYSCSSSPPRADPRKVP